MGMGGKMDWEEGIEEGKGSTGHLQINENYNRSLRTLLLGVGSGRIFTE